MPELRESGIDILGKIPWGTHFCNFYETKPDLLDILVPYFKTGLESKEFCLWVVSTPGLITVQDAKDALEQVVPDLQWQLSNGNIEILNETDWYLKNKLFNLEKVINSWHVKLNRALALGYDGMRVSGDTFWLNEKIWKGFVDYEKQLNKSITDLPVTLLCTYPLAKSGAAEILDVAHNHQFAIARRKGEWEVIETSMQIQAKAEIRRLSKKLQETKIQTKKPTPILGYAVAILSVTLALIVAQILDVRLVTAPVSLFFCALMFSAWYGGIKPGLLSVALSLLAFKFFFINPVYSLASDLREIPRLLIFALSALFVVLLSEAQKDIAESLRHARNILEGTVQKLMQTNTALQKEIAERKQAEDALRKSDDQIRLIIDTIPTMVWSTRPDGNIDFLNQRWLDYSGLSFEQCIKNPMAPVHPEDIPKVMENSLLNRTAGKAYEDEMRLRRADGEYRWFLMRTAPLHDNQGNPIKWYGVSIDIEDSKRTEEQIKQSEAHLAEAQQLAKMGSWDFDIKADRLTWSEELYNIFDTDKQTFDETHGSFLHLIDEGDREFALQTSRYTQQTGEPFIIEYHITTTKGEKRIIHERGYRQTDDTGKVVRLFGTAQDITERKQAEEALQQSYQEIRRLTEHLQKIREEERITIAREIHDELGQQLTVLKMEVKGLNKKLNDADEGIKQKIRDILDLLDTTVKSVRRISSELRPSLLYNLGLVAAMEWHLKEFEKRSGIKTIFNEPKEELELPDSLKNGLFRIFQESLTNVSRHAYANKIMVTLEQKGQQLILSIEDNGRGFKKEKIAAKDTLGILGMKERSQMMGGYYEIISIPAEGTTVIVAVPYTGKNNLI